MHKTNKRNNVKYAAGVASSQWNAESTGLSISATSRRPRAGLAAGSSARWGWRYDTTGTTSQRGTSPHTSLPPRRCLGPACWTRVRGAASAHRLQTTDNIQFSSVQFIWFHSDSYM